jgi:putative Mg2+ transporter-C (MgtC) family protein
MILELEMGMTFNDVLLKILLPLFLTYIISAFVGFERQNVGKAAGLSSHILVALGSAGIAIMQRLMFEQQILLAQSGINIDPEQQRVIAQVVTGIGFVGAGVIIKDQAHVVRGITTAATIWVTAMVGLILGSGYILVGSILGILMVILVLVRDIYRGFNPFKPHHKQEPNGREIK